MLTVHLLWALHCAEHTTHIILLNSHHKHLREYSYSHPTGEYIVALRGQVMFSRLHASKWQSVIQTQPV